jgi:hypothetical protein
MPLLEREVLEQFSYFCEIICMTLVLGIKALFIWFIIRLIQLVFSKNQPTVFFSRLIILAERLLRLCYNLC